jgi:uncharacterized protein YjeT (DUF2065 family)
MTLSSFCVIVGVWELVFGLPMLVRPAATIRWLRDTLKDPTMMRLIGFFFLVISVLVLSEGARVGGDGPGLVRLLAWVTGGKCLLICWWPRQFARMTDLWFSNAAVVRCFGVLATAIGVWLLDLSGSI